MAQSAGELATNEQYNLVAVDVNKFFGDKYSSAAVTDVNRVQTHKFGWGAVNLDDALADGTLITAERLQGMVHRTNIATDHTELTDTVLVFAVPANRTTIATGTPVRAEDLNLIRTKIIPILANNKHLTIDATNASAFVANSTGYERNNTWNTQLAGEHKWSWGSYNKARYFFNGGGQLRVSLNMTGGTTAGFYNWSDVINEMGVLNFNWDTVTQSAAITSGTPTGKGFYDLTQYYGDGSDAGAADEGLLFTSSGVTIGRKVGTYGGNYGYGYGYITGQGLYPSWTSPKSSYGYGYGYGIYISAYSAYSTYQQLKFKLYGKYIDAGAGVQFKMVLDDTTHANIVDGSITPTCSYLMPDTLTIDTTSFDVTPAPTFAITNDFTSADDS